MNTLPRDVCFIRSNVPQGSPDSLTDLFEALLATNRRLQENLCSVASTSPRLTQMNDSRPTSRAGLFAIPENPDIQAEAPGTEHNFKHSRERLKVLYDTLHLTWPDHCNCDLDHSQNDLWRNCKSARLRISGTWKVEADIKERYELLLYNNDCLFECEIEVDSNR